MSAREWIAALVSLLALAPLAGALLPLFVADAAAGAEEISRIATTRETNLRKMPRTDSEIVTLIPRGMTVAVGDCRNGWCRASWNGRNGYIIARNLGTAEAQRWPGASVAVCPGL
jgi:uncharacterized protein YgiM (DUF1202 family)